MVSYSGRKWSWIACHLIRHNSGVESEHVQLFANHSARTDVALLALRIASGLAFFYHGAAILFGMFGGPGPERFAIDHRFPVLLGYLIGLAQVASAIAVLAGAFVRF